MTLLTIVQSVCDEIGLPRPSQVATNSDQLARQMFSLANKELRELSKRYNWPALVRDYQVPVVAGVAAYALPADYRSLVADTAYAANQYQTVRGSLSPYEWQRRKQQLLNSLDRVGFRIYGSPQMMYFDPVPNAANPPLFEYVSKFYVTNMNNERIQQYVSDADTSVVDEDLVQMGLMWRIKHAKGIEFSADKAEYDMAVPREFAKALGTPSLSVGGRLYDSPLTDGYVRDTNFGS